MRYSSWRISRAASLSYRDYWERVDAFEGGKYESTYCALRNEETKGLQAKSYDQVLSATDTEIEFQTVKLALEIASPKLLCVLLDHIESVETRVKSFRYARKMPIYSDNRYCCAFQQLFELGIPENEISEALLDSLKAEDLGDLSFIKLFLEYNASPGYQNGGTFKILLSTNSPVSVTAIKLLIQYITDDCIATVAFDAVNNIPIIEHDIYIAGNQSPIARMEY